MRLILFIFLGGGIGAALRFLLSRFSHHHFGESFPYGTFLINILGSFVIGYLAFALAPKGMELRAFLMVGVLGGFTTFSSYSLEIFDFLENGQIMRGLLYLFLSVGIALFATWGGAILGRK